MARPSITWAEVTVDCRDAERLARFYADLLQADPVADVEGWYRIDPLVPGGPLLNFQPVPEEKDGKVRIHLDLWTDDLDAATALAQELGAAIGGPVGEEAGFTGRVMTDPEGNEFCLVASAPK